MKLEVVFKEEDVEQAARDYRVRQRMVALALEQLRVQIEEAVRLRRETLMKSGVV